MIQSLGRLFARWFASHVELHPTETCPECGSQLVREVDDPQREWRCLNPDCPPQVLARLQLWTSPQAMDLEGFDAALVAQLVKRGLVRDAADFYRLTVAELAALDGIAEARARSLVAAMEASKAREAWRVLVGLGIPHLDAAPAQALCGQFDSLHELLAAARERELAVAGVSEFVARRLKRWLGDPVNRRFVRRLAQAGINFHIRTA